MMEIRAPVENDENDDDDDKDGYAVRLRDKLPLTCNRQIYCQSGEIQLCFLNQETLHLSLRTGRPKEQTLA